MVIYRWKRSENYPGLSEPIPLPSQCLDMPLGPDREPGYLRLQFVFGKLGQGNACIHYRILPPVVM